MQEMKEMKVTLADARKSLGDLIAQVRFGSRHIIITKNSQDAAALVSLEEHKLLSEIRRLRELEHARALLEQAEEEGTISYEEVIAGGLICQL